MIEHIGIAVIILLLQAVWPFVVAKGRSVSILLFTYSSTGFNRLIHPHPSGLFASHRITSHHI